MQAQTVIYDKDRALMRARAQAGLDVLTRNPMVDAANMQSMASTARFLREVFGSE